MVGQADSQRIWKERFPDVFKKGLGTMIGIVGKTIIDNESTPTFWKARIVPYAMKERVNDELERLLNEGIIEAVNHSDWETPIVPY